MRLRRARSDGGWRRLAILRLVLMSTIQTSNARPLVERWRDERCCGTKRGPVSTMAYSTVDDGWQDGQINSLGVSLSPSSNGGFFLRTIPCFGTSPRLVQINHWTRVNSLFTQIMADGFHSVCLFQNIIRIWSTAFMTSRGRHADDVIQWMSTCQQLMRAACGRHCAGRQSVPVGQTIITILV